MTPHADARYSLELHEAVGQINDLWAHVGAFRFAQPHRYPVGTEAIWAFLSDHTEAFPEEWLGFPVVAIIGGKP